MTDLSWTRPLLAQLCGLEHGYMADASTAVINNSFEEWKPDEDVAQAVRCLEAVVKESGTVRITREHWWGVVIDRGALAWSEKLDPKLPRAICLAIADALVWEKP